MYCDNWTPERLEEVFSPGRRVDLLLSGQDRAPRQAVRQSRVLGRNQDDLALSQPQPGLSRPSLGQPLEVTVLVEDQGAPQRYGYRTSVLDLLDDFPDQVDPPPTLVVMFPRCEDIYATNLRRARRYRVGPQVPVALLCREVEAQVLDLSIKGLRFDWRGPGPSLAEGDLLELVLIIHDEKFRVKGRVARVFTPDDHTEVSVNLGILPLDAWTSLQELIQTLEPQDED